MRRTSVCATILLALFLLGAACSHAPTDSQIATSLKAKMFSDPQLRGAALTVTVKNGVATLSGQVNSVSARYEAFTIASESAGVKKVNDRVLIKLP